MWIVIIILKICACLIFGAVAGGLLTGIDRVISAKMQRRKGPPVLQPFYDVIKLLQKEATTVNSITRFYVTFSFFFSIFTVVLFLMGVDILLCIFAFTLSCVFFVIVGYSSYSPYSFVGAEREMIQIMCYEPMILMSAFGIYEVTGSFEVSKVFELGSPIVLKIPLIFIGLVYVLTIKLRKSPFDFSMSHHGHQELVKGITTELTGVCLAMVEVTHWFETVFALGLVFIFFVYKATFSIAIALVIALLIYFFEILIDNTFARIKWKTALKQSWLITGICGGVTLLYLSLFY